MKEEDGYDLWLRYDPVAKEIQDQWQHQIEEVLVPGDSQTLEAVRKELALALPSLTGRNIGIESQWKEPAGPALVAGTGKALKQLGMTLPEGEDCGEEGFRICSIQGNTPITAVFAKTDRGVLYGVFALLRRMQQGLSLEHLDICDQPKLRWRMLNHWDNLDGSIERGYAGLTLWQWDELPETVDSRYTDYARACASVGLNASVLNNVNTQPQILTTAYLLKVKAIADVLRTYGISTFLSVNWGTPQSIGGLENSDPSSAEVQQWWKDKAAEIYQLIPDFGGFLVKADSEGQPGPFAYGKTHADGANMLGKIMAPHGGKIIWRAFVYGHGEEDRAKKAYSNFMAHDGEFLPNVAIQVKNGPIDFQPREPVSPLFGGIRKSALFMEFQVAQEYLGQGNHVVYLGPMWKEILDFDTHADGPGSTVGKTLEQDPAGQGFTGIAAVANTGDMRNWCGSIFHPMNWFAYGRLAWNYQLDPADIAREWIACTFGLGKEITQAAEKIMLSSWDACVDYMTPLCLNHIMKEHHHYGPDPGFDAGAREDWRSTYYHRADKEGLGFNRSRSGSAAVDQYHKPVADMFNDIDQCPEKYILWFHHVPWDRVMQSGRSLRDELEYRYQRGVEKAEALRSTWLSAKGFVDEERYQAVLEKLNIQVEDAKEWRDVCVPYFLSFKE